LRTPTIIARAITVALPQARPCLLRADRSSHATLKSYPPLQTLIVRTRMRFFARLRPFADQRSTNRVNIPSDDLPRQWIHTILELALGQHSMLAGCQGGRAVTQGDECEIRFTACHQQHL
jgi:hypothetical protein